MLHARDVLAELKTGHRDLVTQYDKQVQQLIVELLRSAVPEAEFFCEEEQQRGCLNKGPVFIIDPIDGTMNFVKGFGHSAISVAYACDGVLEAASVYAPYRNEQFTAIKGRGAYLNGQPIRAVQAPLSESIVCCGTAPYDTQLAEESFRLMKLAFLNSLDIRREGSAALDMCSAAAGRAGVYFEQRVSLWDVAAGLLLVEEAGGCCCTLEGGPIPFDGSRFSVLAGGRQAVEDMLRLIKP